MKKRKKYEEGGVATTSAAPADVKPSRSFGKDPAKDATKSAVESYKESFKALKRAGKDLDLDRAAKQNYKNYLRGLTDPGEFKRGLKSGTMTSAPEITPYNAQTTYARPDSGRMARAAMEARSPMAARTSGSLPALARGAGFGGSLRKMGMKSGGSVGSASKRADGIAQRGKTRGRLV